MSFKKFLPGLTLGVIFIVAFFLGLSGMGSVTTSAKPAPGPAVTIPSGNTTSQDLVPANNSADPALINQNDTANNTAGTGFAPAPQFGNSHEGHEHHGGESESHEHEGDDD